MSEIKLNLSIEIPGRTMFRENECLKKIERHLKCIPARQTVNISKEAYTYMVGDNSAPSHITHKAWIGMSKKERLQTHLKMIADDLGGTSYTYKVFED